MPFRYFYAGLLYCATAIFKIVLLPSAALDRALKLAGVKPFKPPHEVEIIDRLQRFISDCSVNAIVRWDGQVRSLPEAAALAADIQLARKYVRDRVKSGDDTILFVDLVCGDLVMSPGRGREIERSISYHLGVFKLHRDRVTKPKYPSLFHQTPDYYLMMLAAVLLVNCFIEAYGLEGKADAVFDLGPDLRIREPKRLIDYFPEILTEAYRVNLFLDENFGLPKAATRPISTKPEGGADSPPITYQNKPGAVGVTQTKNTGASTPGASEGLGQKKQDLSSQLDKYNLTAQQRNCISLRTEYGLEPREIGERLGITRQRVDQHLKKAEDRMNNFNANDRKRRGVNKGVPSYDAAENDY